jgi:hypothetical protein
MQRSFLIIKRVEYTERLHFKGLTAARFLRIRISHKPSRTLAKILLYFWTLYYPTDVNKPVFNYYETTGIFNKQNKWLLPK